MSGRVPPPDDPLIIRLRGELQDLETEDVVTLLGRVASGPPGHTRIYPDHEAQRWMDIPNEDIVDSARVEGDDENGGRTALFVRRGPMQEPMFNEAVLEALEEHFAGSWMSTWSLIPDSRYVAAQMLELIPEEYS